LRISSFSLTSGYESIIKSRALFSSGSSSCKCWWYSPILQWTCRRIWPSKTFQMNSWKKHTSRHICSGDQLQECRFASTIRSNKRNTSIQVNAKFQILVDVRLKNWT
jgi:hypothetical protein